MSIIKIQPSEARMPVVVVGWALPTTGLRTFFQFRSELTRPSLINRRMNETQLIQGRLISPEDIEQIRALMIEIRMASHTSIH
jgi:hypothetical protein